MLSVWLWMAVWLCVAVYCYVGVLVLVYWYAYTVAKGYTVVSIRYLSHVYTIYGYRSLVYLCVRVDALLSVSFPRGICLFSSHSLIYLFCSSVYLSLSYCLSLSGSIYAPVAAIHYLSYLSYLSTFCIYLCIGIIVHRLSLSACRRFLRSSSPQGLSFTAFTALLATAIPSCGYYTCIVTFIIIF